jgi:hypothetical protein
MTTEQADVATPSPSRRFTVRTGTQANAPGTWDSTAVTVLDGGVEVGGYERNYHCGGSSTFAPFVGPDGNRYALYSRDYTATRLMSLPDCRDLGGEESDSWGFCPVELHVPSYRLWTCDREVGFGPRAGEVERFSKVIWERDERLTAEVLGRIAREASGEPGDGKMRNHALSDWRSPPFGFVAGCVWGDDCSWKIQWIDLSRVAEGVIERVEKFGYLELPDRLGLADAVDLCWWEPGSDHVRLVHQERFHLRTGTGDRQEQFDLPPWSPIKDAPRDGTPFLALGENTDLPHTVFYRDGVLLSAWDHKPFGEATHFKHLGKDADGRDFDPVPAPAAEGA